MSIFEIFPQDREFPEHSLFPNIYNYNDYIAHKFDN